MNKTSKAEVADTKRIEKKTTARKTWLFVAAVAVLVVFAFTGLSVRYHSSISYDVNTGDVSETSEVTLDDIQARYDEFLSDANRKWVAELAKMEGRIDVIIRTRLDRMYSRWTSSQRLDAFVDEYYGYFKGWKFLYLSGKDLLDRDTDGEALGQEINAMIMRHILLDLDSDMNALFVELEEYITTNTGQFMERLLKELDSAFSEEELQRLGRGFHVGNISVAPSELQSFIRTGADFPITYSVAGAIFARIAPKIVSRTAAGSGGRLLSRIVSKVATTLTSSILGKFITGFGIGLLVDYALVKIAKAAGQEDLKDSLEAGMKDFRSTLNKEISGRFRNAFGEIAQEKLFH